MRLRWFQRQQLMWSASRIIWVTFSLTFFLELFKENTAFWIYWDLIAFLWTGLRWELVFSMPWPSGRIHIPGQVLLWLSSFPRAGQDTHRDAASVSEMGLHTVPPGYEFRLFARHSWGGAAVWAEAVGTGTPVLPLLCFLPRIQPSSGNPNSGTKQNTLSVSLDQKRHIYLLVDQQMIWWHFSASQCSLTGLPWTCWSQHPERLPWGQSVGCETWSSLPDLPKYFQYQEINKNE